MRVSLPVLIAALAVSAAVGAGITYVAVGEDETKRQLESAFDDAQRAMDDAAEEYVVDGADGYDRSDSMAQAFASEADFMPPHITVEICDAAEEGGAESVNGYLRSEDYPFEPPNDMDYYSNAWVDYCTA